MKVNLPNRGRREVKESKEKPGTYLWRAYREGTWFVCTAAQNAVIQTAILEDLGLLTAKPVNDKEAPTLKDIPAAKVPFAELPPAPPGKEYGPFKKNILKEFSKKVAHCGYNDGDLPHRQTTKEACEKIGGPPVVIAKVVLKKKKATNPLHVRVGAWMRLRARCYDTSTQAAEACADELDLYENTQDYKIPEYVFEIAGKHLPTR